ncbi:MAG: MarR family transcriptional regulator, partial [Candidatus Omnitrophica bacterium]|nr:MarR family transcriptional regulator [Candidatus Omnitrophota bacterium]
LMAKRQSDALLRGKITLPQFMVLEFLYREKKAIMSEIAKILSVTAPAATGIVDKLVRDGYLFRENDPANRRIILVKLTKKGESLIDKVIRQRKELIKDIFGKLTEKERKDYLNILTKIYKFLLENPKTG